MIQFKEELQRTFIKIEFRVIGRNNYFRYLYVEPIEEFDTEHFKRDIKTTSGKWEYNYQNNYRFPIPQEKEIYSQWQPCPANSCNEYLIDNYFQLFPVEVVQKFTPKVESKYYEYSDNRGYLLHINNECLLDFNLYKIGSNIYYKTNKIGDLLKDYDAIDFTTNSLEKRDSKPFILDNRIMYNSTDKEFLHNVDYIITNKTVEYFLENIKRVIDMNLCKTIEKHIKFHDVYVKRCSENIYEIGV